MGIEREVVDIKHSLIPWERFVKIGRMRPNLLYGRAIGQIDQLNNRPTDQSINRSIDRPINRNKADVTSLDRE